MIALIDSKHTYHTLLLLLLLVQRFKEIKKSTMPANASRGVSVQLSSKRLPSVTTDRSLMVVSRADFIEHYPQLLLESTVEKNADNDEEALSAEKPGVDICFEAPV